METNASNTLRLCYGMSELAFAVWNHLRDEIFTNLESIQHLRG